MIPLIFVGMMLAIFLVMMIMLRPKATEKALEKRLQVISVPRKEADAEETLAVPGKKSKGLAFHLGEFVERFHFSENIEELILHSGSKSTVGGVVAASLLAAVGAGVAAQMFIGLLPIDIVAVIAGACSRWGLLRMQKSRRLNKFNDALADAIELMARALKAGHSMSSSIEIIAEQSPEPLAGEFAIVFQQQKFGIPFRDAILQLGDRVPSKDLHFLITAILVQKETGGDLTEILDRTTEVIRERVKIEGEIKTYTAQGRLTGWILSGLPVAMLILINFITPSYSRVLFTDPLGQKLMYGGAGFIALGAFVISRIVDIKV